MRRFRMQQTGDQLFHNQLMGMCIGIGVYGTSLIIFSLSRRQFRGGSYIKHKLMLGPQLYRDYFLDQRLIFISQSFRIPLNYRPVWIEITVRE